MNSFVTFRCQNQAKVRSFVGKKHVSKIARLQVQGGVIALESTALVVVSDRGVGRIKSYRGTELDVFDPKARAHASHHGLSWQVFSRNGKGRVFDQSEKPWENPARRWIQSMDLRQGLKKRREKGLPTPTDYNQHQAATKIQAPFVCPEKLSYHMTIENHSARRGQNPWLLGSTVDFWGARGWSVGPFNITLVPKFELKSFCATENGVG